MPVTLDTPGFRLRALPEQGGKMEELYDCRLGRNLLLPPAPTTGLPLPDGAVFSVSGWDECLPTVEASAGVPDLGYAWRTTPECTIAGHALFTRWTVPGWRMDRAVELYEDGLAARYTITNVGSRPASMLWAAHVLLPLEDLQRVDLPTGDAIAGPECDLHELSARLSEGTDQPFTIEDLRRRDRSWKFFLPAIAPIVLRYADAVLTMHTDAAWWGIWLNEGHFCDLLCLGIEPTTTPSDALADSEMVVEPGQPATATWTLQRTIEE